jgi:hypothetical protein
MLHSRGELELFHKLLALNFPYELSPGIKIGRGFADVGFEEYSVLTGNKAVSLSTGKIIELDEFYQNYYFAILTADQIVKELFVREWDIKNCQFIDQRTWMVEIEKGKITYCENNNSLLISLLKLLIKILN